MQIWIIRDGEKLGPFSDFDVRRDIEDGRYPSDTPAWHEGLASWTTLGEMAVFRSEFGNPVHYRPPRHKEQPADPPPPRPASPFPDSPHPEAAQAPGETGNLHLIRRFWARWMDLQLYIAAWWLFLYLSNRDVGSIFQSPWFLLLQLLPWLPIEAALIHRHGTTPGKWLLGIRVRNDDGSALTGRQSTTRTLRVLVAGVGLGWGIISPICQGASYWITRRIGRPLWDHLGGHRVDFTPIRGTRYIAVIGVIYLSLQLQFAVLAPHMVPMYIEQFPALKEYFEKNPPSHFPERHERPSR